VVLGCLAVFLILAVWGYKPAYGLELRQRAPAEA
jgi:hypothetical protein